LRGAFFVRAPSTYDETIALDGELDGVRASVVLAELASLSLYSGHERVFLSGDHLLDSLDDDVADTVTSAVYRVLCRIAPAARRSDSARWLARLKDGAMDRSNDSLAWALACSVDGALARGAIPRPDRYFQTPAHELNEGQWLAFRAVRWACVERFIDRRK
jgi:hypothetical protein